MDPRPGEIDDGTSVPPEGDDAAAVVSTVRESTALTTNPSLRETIGIVLPNQDATIAEVAEALVTLPKGKLLDLVEAVVRQGLGDEMKDIIDMYEIIHTESQFDDPEKREKLEETAREYGFKVWIEQQEGRSPTSVTRIDLQRWWEFFTQMADLRGIKTGKIDPKSQNNNLWKATRKLAIKLKRKPSVYMNLPSILVNNPDQVAKALADIKSPIAFIEVLIGEAWEDLCTSPTFLSAFSTLEGKEGAEGAVATVMLAMQRKI